jgi:uncharacterized membrane protein YfcA
MTLFTDPAFLITATIAVILLGLAKGGFAGLGALATPIMALVIAPTTAAAILLPILIVQDVVSVWSFRHSWDRALVAWMFPGALIGIALAFVFAASVPERAIMGVLGLITFAFGGWRLWVERGNREVAASTAPLWIGSLFGVAMGFTSQIAHAGGPPFQMYVLPRKLPHLTFVGTSSILFAMVNWAKLPAFFALGEFTRANLIAAALLMPLAIASTFAGVWLIKRIEARRFYTLVNTLMLLLGAQLMWRGVGG